VLEVKRLKQELKAAQKGLEHQESRQRLVDTNRASLEEAVSGAWF